MGSTPKQGLPKFKIFNLLSWTHKMFKVSKYKRKTKFDQNLGLPKWRVSPQKRGRQNLNFLTTGAGQMEFSVLVNIKKRQNLTKFGDTKVGPLKQGHPIFEPLELNGSNFENG